MDPRDIAFIPQSLDAPWASPVRVRWLGTAAFEISHGDHVLLFDPYVTRASLARCVARDLVPDEARIARYFPKADAIVLGHTHFDHALDAPFIAKATGARVFGSRSAAVLCRGEGVPESQMDVVERPAGSAPVDRDVGPFHLRFHASAHSRFFFGRVPAAGDIQDCTDVPMRAEAYKCGAVFGVEIRVAGRVLFHLGSAELLDAALGKLSVDLVLLTVAGWTSSHAFPSRAMRALSPRAVLLGHWDNFLLPIEKGAKVLPAMQMGRLVDELEREARDVRVGTLPILGEVRV
jgi:L-ascorbate metabolism protein UlaG (beta-lactamase superfamily)